LRFPNENGRLRVVKGSAKFFGDLMKRQRAARGPLLNELGQIEKR
jgi:hypothetical protein